MPTASAQEPTGGAASPVGVGGGGLEWQVGAALHELSVTLRRDAAEVRVKVRVREMVRFRVRANPNPKPN